MGMGSDNLSQPELKIQELPDNLGAYVNSRQLRATVAFMISRIEDPKARKTAFKQALYYLTPPWKESTVWATEKGSTVTVELAHGDKIEDVLQSALNDYRNNHGQQDASQEE